MADATIMRTDTESVLSRWVEEEIRPWRDVRLDAASVPRELDRIHDEIPNIFVMDIADGAVRVREKRTFDECSVAQTQHWQRRCDHYRRYFQDCVETHGLDLSTAIAIEMRDLSSASATIPILSFQKPTGSNRLLMPDVDFMNHDWYRETFAEPPHHDKIDRAVFVGSSTGGGQLGADDVLAARPDRLRLARELLGHPRVDFRIAAAVQCDTPETARLLQEQPYFSPPIAWHDQLRYRYLLSVDGNGATCSRVVNALRSRSVLLKYRSQNQLYYFKGLVPGVHFLPIDGVDDIGRVMDDADRGRIDTPAIVRDANAFAERYLRRDGVLRYGALLLTAFDALMTGRCGAPPRG